MHRAILAVYRFCISLVIPACLLAGCASGISSVAETFRFLGSRNAATENATLSPSQRYLRVVVDGRVVLLALGYITHNPNGVIETWYSAQGEVLKLQDGRIVGTTGLITDWREVRFSTLPNWLAVSDSPVAYSREHDEMPGYRIGIQEKLLLRSVPPPQRTSLQGLAADHLRWFEEQAESMNGAHVLPPSRYAIEFPPDGPRVVYGEHCFSESICISWQHWPVGK